MPSTTLHHIVFLTETPISWHVSTPALTTDSSLEAVPPQTLAIWSIFTEPSCNSWSWRLTESPFQPWLKSLHLSETHLDPLLNNCISNSSSSPLLKYQYSLSKQFTLEQPSGTSLLRTHQAQIRWPYTSIPGESFYLRVPTLHTELALDYKTETNICFPACKE